MHFLEMIWRSTSFSLACPSTLDPLGRFEELLEKDLELLEKDLAFKALLGIQGTSWK
jgi:hypothetical protein